LRCAPPPLLRFPPLPPLPPLLLLLLLRLLPLLPLLLLLLLLPPGNRGPSVIITASTRAAASRPSARLTGSSAATLTACDIPGPRRPAGPDSSATLASGTLPSTRSVVALASLYQ
jgi:hypothetical protein